MSLENILETTLHRFFTEDISLNQRIFGALDANLTGNLVEELNGINSFRDFIIPPNREREREQEPPGDTDDSDLPNLIPIDNEAQAQAQAPVAQAPVVQGPAADEGIRLWTNVINDYDAQFRAYQENIRTILDITQTFLPQRRRVERERDLPVNNSYWTTFLRNNGVSVGNNAFTIDLERIFPSETNTASSPSPPTNIEIASATTNFLYDPSNNALTSTTCPISLEEFQDGESLTRILHCRHVFKTTELTRWFMRNAHCPTCRYDIRIR